MIPRYSDVTIHRLVFGDPWTLLPAVGGRWLFASEQMETWSDLTRFQIYFTEPGLGTEVSWFPVFTFESH